MDPFGPFGSNTDPMTQPDKNNSGPRLGLVYDVLGNQKLVLRAGGGIGYAPPTFMLYYDYAFLNPKIPFNPIIAVSDLPSGFRTAFPFDTSFIPSVIGNPSLLPKNLVLSRSGEPQVQPGTGFRCVLHLFENAHLLRRGFHNHPRQ